MNVFSNNIIDMLTKKKGKKYHKKTLKYKKDSKQKTFYVRTKDERVNLLIENLLEKYGYKKGSKFPVDFVFIANNYLLYKYTSQVLYETARVYPFDLLFLQVCKPSPLILFFPNAGK